MIMPWNELNTKGKLLLLLCVLNVILAIFLAKTGSVVCFCSAVTAMFCGIATYAQRYRKNKRK